MRRVAINDYSGPDPTRIKSMFGSIAGRYDRANTIMSACVHHRWRRAAVRWSSAKAGDAVRDCATVTGERGSYEYLESSAARFPGGDDFVALMRGAETFTSIHYRPLTFGIAYLYRGVV